MLRCPRLPRINVLSKMLLLAYFSGASPLKSFLSSLQTEFSANCYESYLEAWYAFEESGQLIGIV
jgi:hypothetical protein